MVSYFKELENPNDYYLDLMNTRLCCGSGIDLKELNLSFFEKYARLFILIKNLDLLFENSSKEKKLYLNPDMDDSDIMPLEWVYSSFINDDFELDCTNFSKNGIEKMKELKKEYSNRYSKNDFTTDFYEYFIAIYDQFIYSDNGITCSKKSIFNYLSSAKIMAKYQDKLSKEEEMLFDEALMYIRDYKIQISHKDFEPVTMYLPNSWYITPYNHLYNTMGPDGHKEANLIYPLYYSIFRDDHVMNPYDYLNGAKKILKQGFVDKNTFDIYTNLAYDFSTVLPESYYQLSDLEKMKYRILHKKTYNPKIVNLIAGIKSAQAGLFSFFYYLKNNSCDYYSDLDFVRQFTLDEILIRCCGFHKISSVCDKTITTSCIYYEEEFKEYIRRGWKIDFVKPIILNPYTKRVEEYPDQFLLIKKMHCNSGVN